MAFISLDSFISSKTNIKFKVYEPTYRMGPVGCETNLTQKEDLNCNLLI